VTGPHHQGPPQTHTYQQQQQQPHLNSGYVPPHPGVQPHPHHSHPHPHPHNYPGTIPPTSGPPKQTMREVGVIMDCLFCNSLFVVCVKMIDLKAFRERQSKELLLKHCQRIQRRCKEGGYPYMCCPLCTELVTGGRYHECIGDRRSCVLSICRYMVFSEEDDNTPIYINMAEKDKKPKWTLMQGTGPKTLELDKNGYTISKPSLRSCGIYSEEYISEKTKQEHEYIISTVFQAIRTFKHSGKEQEAEQMVFELFKLLPLYKNWGKVQEQIGVLVADMSSLKL